LGVGSDLGRKTREDHTAREDGRIRILVTPDLLTEINRILDYPKLKVMLQRSRIRMDIVLAKITEITHVTQSRRTVRVIEEDPADKESWSALPPAELTT